MYSREQIKAFIANTPEELKGQSIDTITKKPYIFLGKRKNPETNTISSIYLTSFHDEDFTVVVENGNII